MKKRMVLLMALLMALLLSNTVASAETPDLFTQIRGMTFEFASGAGAWSTELTVGENGTFTGNFHDSEMGETGEGYPDGTQYGCVFHGQFSDPEKIDEYSWKVQISVEPDEGQAPETIEDQIRYVTATPYGLEKAKTVIFFLPGMAIDRLPEDFIPWTYLYETTPETKEIPYYAIWNEEDDAGFICYATAETKTSDRTVVTALAAEVNPDHLVSVAFDAKINACADGAFTITILVPERYDPEEIRALKIGDGLYTQGREVDIRSISEDQGYLVLNAGSADEVYLFEGIDLNYWIMDVNDNTWTELPAVKVPASEHLIFLDGINPKTGESLIYPTVYNMDGFQKLLNDKDDPGFDICNVELVIDEEGKLALIQRFYVPWQ